MTDSPQHPRLSSADLISLAQAAELSGFTHPHMRLLARQGKIWAIKIGRNC